MPDPLEQGLNLLDGRMMIAIMMGNYPALDPFPPKLRSYVMSKKSDYGSHTRHAVHMS